MIGPARTRALLRGGMVTALVLSVTPHVGAQESVTITLPAAVVFDVSAADSQTVGSPDPTTVAFSTAVLVPGRALRISVIADGASFSSPGGTAPTASAVSWTVANAASGTGLSGTLSSSSYGQVFQSFPLALSGRFDVTWTLASLAGGLQAGTHTLRLRWKIESVLP